ncbi:alkaline phosphatase family protein [Flavobacteriaceae bacterium]|nr:alkaline phosphatase family protein [Flavobacteriaceae bacterium]
MKKTIALLSLFFILFSCSEKQADFTIAFGSCNNQNLDNPFWDQIIRENPGVWIWGGDIIYSDTEDMAILEANYEVLKNNPNYQKFEQNIPVMMGTWDDHDFGMNDGGEHYSEKWTSQQLFLDFFEVPLNSKRRVQKGIYDLEDFDSPKGSVRVFSLDTRYFRTDLKADPSGKKRYLPDSNPESTMLGKAQWAWLEKNLSESQADFNVINSSIQVLSGEHGFESWANFPLETKRLEALIRNSKAKNVIILSGDRHISEFSEKQLPGLAYPLIDFTSSGMTHYYEGFSGENNPYRIGEVVADKTYGLLKFNFDSGQVDFIIKGTQDKVLEHISRHYPMN